MDVILDTTELDRIIRDWHWNAEQVIIGEAFKLKGEAKQNVQRCEAIDTGAMHASIYTRTKRNNPFALIAAKVTAKNPKAGLVELRAADGDIVAVVGPSVDYAIYVEYGTSRMAARPFFTAAANTIRQMFNNGATYRALFDKRLAEAQEGGE